MVRRDPSLSPLYICVRNEAERMFAEQFALFDSISMGFKESTGEKLRPGEPYMPDGEARGEERFVLYPKYERES
jgi:hypothetical protein